MVSARCANRVSRARPSIPSRCYSRSRVTTVFWSRPKTMRILLTGKCALDGIDQGAVFRFIDQPNRTLSMTGIDRKLET
jgi:hypothetical protein